MNVKEKLIKNMETKATEKPAKIIICEGWDERALRATDDILKKGLAKIILIGEPNVIKREAKKFKVDISKALIIDHKTSELIDELAEKLVELRKHKGMTSEKAKELLQDVNYFGCMYVYAGYADAVGGSLICSTADIMRPALQILRDTTKLASEVSAFYDVKNKRVIFASDGSMNINPTPEQLAQMAINAADCVKGFGIEPIVGMLSFSTKGSGGDGPEIQHVRDAIKIAKEKDPSLKIDGEFQVDAAVNPDAAKRKCPDSELAGKVNTLIFPNLTASNIFFHGMGQFSDMEFVFTILSGLLKPVAIFGRTTPLSMVRNLVVTLAMQVNSNK